MVPFRIALTFGLLALVNPAVQARPEIGAVVSAPQGVRDLIDTSLALCAAKQYGPMIRRALTPDELQKHIDGGRFDGLVQNFAGEKADRFVRILQAVKVMTPTTIEPDKVVYELPEDVGDRLKKLGFVQVDGVWYIED